MAYPTRIKYAAAQKAEMWNRWQNGEPLYSTARLFDRSHASIQGILAATGGIRTERRRSRRVLTLSEREHISWGIVAGHSIRSIATSFFSDQFPKMNRILANKGRVFQYATY